jgi:hypothetical protein
MMRRFLPRPEGRGIRAGDLVIGNWRLNYLLTSSAGHRLIYPKM